MFTIINFMSWLKIEVVMINMIIILIAIIALITIKQTNLYFIASTFLSITAINGFIKLTPISTFLFYLVPH